MATAIARAAEELGMSEAEVYDILVDQAELLNEIAEFTASEIIEMVNY